MTMRSPRAARRTSCGARFFKSRIPTWMIAMIMATTAIVMPAGQPVGGGVAAVSAQLLRLAHQRQQLADRGRIQAARGARAFEPDPRALHIIGVEPRERRVAERPFSVARGRFALLGCRVADVLATQHPRD